MMVNMGSAAQRWLSIYSPASQAPAPVSPLPGARLSLSQSLACVPWLSPQMPSNFIRRKFIGITVNLFRGNERVGGLMNYASMVEGGGRLSESDKPYRLQYTLEPCFVFKSY